MSHDEFVQAVMAETGSVDREQAAGTALVILQAVCDRITADDAHDLLAQLPAAIREQISTSAAAAR